MESERSALGLTKARGAGPRRRRIRIALASVACLVAMATFASVAFAVYVYGHGNVAPGGFFQTPTAKFQTDNYGCRDGGGNGIAEVTDIGRAGSGNVTTNCQATVYAHLTLNGTFQVYCSNEGTVSWTIYCQTSQAA
jgi:hypothetical protein